MILLFAYNVLLNSRVFNPSDGVPHIEELDSLS